MLRKFSTHHNQVNKKSKQRKMKKRKFQGYRQFWPMLWLNVKRLNLQNYNATTVSSKKKKTLPAGSFERISLNKWALHNFSLKRVFWETMMIRGLKNRAKWPILTSKKQLMSRSMMRDSCANWFKKLHKHKNDRRLTFSVSNLRRQN